MTLWVKGDGTGMMAHGCVNGDLLPCPTIMAGGLGGAGRSQYYLEDDGRSPVTVKTPKPPYRVPSMAEIKATVPNGFCAASTFSGCGGSSLGYKMAGFRVLWANEFVPAAQEVYRLNHPDTALDTRDIRRIKPADVLAVCRLGVGDLDLLDGSPPCASFSTAGRRQANWGKVKDYSDTKQRTDDLFFEFARLVQGIRPKVFVAENVSGLVKGSAKGYFKEILAALKACGYRVEARLLDAQWLGVPQARQRLIFMGVRDDLKTGPEFPAPLPYRYSVRDALPEILSVSCLLSGKKPGVKSSDLPSPTIDTAGIGATAGYVTARVMDDTSGQFSQGDVTDRPCPAITVGVGGLNSRHYQVVEPESKKITTQVEQIIGNDAFAPKWGSLDQPHPTILSGGAHGGSGELRDKKSLERRRFTIAELKRICSFPDDFQLTGTYAQQWERLGRAVPPVMMAAVARYVEGVLRKCAAFSARS